MLYPWTRMYWINRWCWFEQLSLKLFPLLCFFSSGRSVRSSLTSSLKIARLWGTPVRLPSWSPGSRAAWLTSASSPTALAPRLSALPWPRCRTTWTRLLSRWTRCTWPPVATPRGPQIVRANLPTKWRSTGNEYSEESLWTSKALDPLSPLRLPFFGLLLNLYLVFSFWPVKNWFLEKNVCVFSHCWIYNVFIENLCEYF